MYAAKCLEVLIVLAGLGVMWVLYRKKTNQIMLVVALTIFLGGVLRLFQIKDNEQTVSTVAIILALLGTVWVASWLSNRSATKRRRQGERAGDTNLLGGAAGSKPNVRT